MSKNRMINTKFWSDTWVVDDLNPLDRYLFLYLLTNEKTNVGGIYEISFRTIANETGIDKEEVERMIKRLEPKVLYVDGWVCLLNFAKHQSKNPNMDKGIKRELEQVPGLIKAKIDEALISFEKLPKASGNLNLTLTKPNLTKPKPIGKNNPEVEEVVTAFKTQVGRMRRERYQAAAASKLLGEYGRERTLAAVGAVVASRGRPYAPGITNLEDLWEKWLSLENFYRREVGRQTNVGEAV